VAQDELPPIPVNAEVTPPIGDIDDAFPVWTGWDVVKITIISIVSLVFFSLLVLMIATGLPMFKTTTLKDLSTDARLAVVSQILAYAATFWFVYRLIARHYAVSFGPGLHWRWPGSRWLGYLLGGVVVAMLIQALARFLPIPKQMPIDQFFRTPAAAWSLALFGTFVAPLTEELYFRGLLFPVLKRSIGLNGSLIITAFGFALLHAAQLGMAWAPVLVLFLVGLILTMVRAATHSLAASTLMHIGYNATLFGLLYASTDGFRHLEKALQ
jgi:membrane protease YdiL (CAAX protease family)